MKNEVKLNRIYEIQEMDSMFTKTNFVPEEQEIGNWVGDGWVIIWMHSGIEVGKVEAGNIKWESDRDLYRLDWKDHLVELRVFNPHCEWHVWRAGGQVTGRKRIDDTTEGKPINCKALDTCMKLRGVVAAPLQETGFPWTPTLLLTTRNYLGENEAGMVGYQDVRFVDIIPMEVKK